MNFAESLGYVPLRRGKTVYYSYEACGFNDTFTLGYNRILSIQYVSCVMFFHRFLTCGACGSIVSLTCMRHVAWLTSSLLPKCHAPTASRFHWHCYILIFFAVNRWHPFQGKLALASAPESFQSLFMFTLQSVLCLTTVPTCITCTSCSHCRHQCQRWEGWVVTWRVEISPRGVERCWIITNHQLFINLSPCGL